MLYYTILYPRITVSESSLYFIPNTTFPADTPVAVAVPALGILDAQHQQEVLDDAYQQVLAVAVESLLHGASPQCKVHA